MVVLISLWILILLLGKQHLVLIFIFKVEQNVCNLKACVRIIRGYLNDEDAQYFLTVVSLMIHKRSAEGG